MQRQPKPGRRRFLARVAAGAGLAGAACAPAPPRGIAGAAGLPEDTERRERFNAVDFGAHGNGRSDDTQAIQAAIDAAAERGGGEVFFPPRAKPYRVTTLTLRTGVTLVGTVAWGIDSPAWDGPTLLGDGDRNVIEVATAETEGFNIGLRDLSIAGGRNQFVSNDHCVWCTMRNVRFSGPEEACIRTRGFVQNWYLENVDLGGGMWGYLQEALPGTRTGANSLLDKSYFRGVHVHGQSRNGMRIEVKTSNNVAFEGLSLIQTREHAFVLDGGIRHWTFVNVNTEANNYMGPTLNEARRVRRRGDQSAFRAAPVTAGRIDAGSVQLHLDDPVRFRAGEIVNVAGAGADGLDLEARIASGGGTRTVVLDTPASVGVRGAEVTGARFSDFWIGSSVAGSAAITWIEAAVGHANDGGMPRYAIDASRAAGPLLFVGGSAPRPIYDPYNKVSVLGTPNVLVRRRERDFGQEWFQTFTIGAAGARTQIPSGPGRDLVMALVDSRADGSGTHGKLEVRRFDPNRTQLFELDAQGNGAFRGERVAVANASIVSGEALPEGRVAAPPGSLYLRSGDTPGPRLFVKARAHDAHGWVALAVPSV